MLTLVLKSRTETDCVDFNPQLQKTLTNTYTARNMGVTFQHDCYLHWLRDSNLNCATDTPGCYRRTTAKKVFRTATIQCVNNYMTN